MLIRTLLTATAAVALAGAANAVAFTNGSFETSVGNDPGGSFVSLGAGDSSITGWTVGNGGIDYIGGYWQAADGSRSLDLSQTSAGSIAQTFDTVIGNLYTVTFALAGNVDGGVKSVLVSATGGIGQAYSFDTAGRSYANMGWTDNVYSFTASSTATTLTFLSHNSSAYGPALDNVRVESTAGAVPEPASWAMMLGGFGLVGLAMRRRRQTAIA